MLDKNTYAIATGNYQSTKAAAKILDQGGNAYDAILAALFVSFVCEPLLSSPGGGGYLLAHPKGENAKIFDFFAQTPHNKVCDNNQEDNKDFYPIHGDFGDTQQEFHIGMATAAVPGVPAGIFAIHHHCGSLPLIDIASAAINLASQGMVVDKLHAQVIQILTPILNHSCHAKALFSNKQQLLKQGDIKPNQHLAQFLSKLANNPVDWFYCDTPAKDIVSDIRQHHGLLRKDDFQNYQVHIRDPLIETINSWKIITNTAPSTGGKLIVEQLKHANNNHNNQEKNVNKQLIEAMVYADKLKNNGDFQSSKGTTHMSVIDAAGNVASLTISNGEGCGYVVPNSGFMLNNFLGEEDINTNGFFNFKENTRMASMMSPTILENKETRIALGTGGSNRIKTAMFQVIWQIIAENKTLDQAINHPRFHFENGKLDIEKGFPQQSLDKIKQHCQNVNIWQSRSLYFGGINAVQHGSKNLAVADSRRNGVGLVKTS
ncbi:MAG: gamma-glutamyltransferase [Proteobacteria bacterium]|nr:gamma-glutamyltransferase [Pseudomonadota bacterium]